MDVSDQPSRPRRAPRAPGDGERHREAVAYERSPVDVLRLVVGSLLLLVALVSVAVFGGRVARRPGRPVRRCRHDSDLGGRRGPRHHPTPRAGALRWPDSWAWWSPADGASCSRRWRRWRWRPLPVQHWHPGSAATTRPSPRPPSTSVRSPPGASPLSWRSPRLAAAATVAEPWVPRLWRRLAWVLVIAVTVAQFVVSPTSLDAVVAIIVGWVVGSAGLVVLGGPVRRPTDRAVAEGLAGVGLPVVDLAKASVDARGSTPFFATSTEGDPLFVKALGGRRAQRRCALPGLPAAVAPRPR